MISSEVLEKNQGASNSRNKAVTIEIKKGTLSVQIDANLLEEFVRKATHGPNRRIHKTSLDALTTVVFTVLLCF